jgi:hypothetical protein
VIYVRDKRLSSTRRVGKFLSEVPWDFMVSSNRSCEENVNNFTCIINYALDTLTPLKAVLTNDNDRPWVNNNLRTLINKRQKAFAQGNQTLYKMLRSKVNRSRKRCRTLYYKNKVKDMKHTKPKDW